MPPPPPPQPKPTAHRRPFSLVDACSLVWASPHPMRDPAPRTLEHSMTAEDDDDPEWWDPVLNVRRLPDDLEEEDQTTPRASLAGLSILPDAVPGNGNGNGNGNGYGMSRDDTAADLSMYMLAHETEDRVRASSRHPTPVPPRQPPIYNASASCENRPPARAPSSAVLPDQASSTGPDASTHCESIPPLLAPLGDASRQHQAPSTAPANSVGADASAGQSKQARSLGRRFSRNYKEKMAELKDGLTKSAPFSGRMRRASTPLNAVPVVQINERPVDPRQALAPLSPSKRNARHPSDPRVRKFRSFGLTSNDRKDTPAPPPLGHAAQPAPRSATASDWQLPGGDGARRAAAASKNEVLNWGDEHWPRPGEVGRDMRRRPLGSLSSAADSGADLGTFGDDSCKDSVGAADDMEMDAKSEFEMEEGPMGLNLVEILPSELVLQIFEYLDAKDLLLARCAGRAWKAMVDEASVWRTSYLRRYKRQTYTDPAPTQVGGLGVGRTNKPNQEWKKMYKARLELEQNWRKGAQDAGKAIYLSGHTDSVYCLQFDEEKIITGSRDRTIRVWDINTFQCTRVIGGPNVKPVLGPKVLRTVDYPAFHLATASVNGTHYGDSLYHIPSQWHDASILCLQYDNEILVTGSSDSDLLIWDIRTYEPRHRLCKHTGGVLDVALDNNYIVSCSKDSRIIVWDRKTFEPKGDLIGHRGPVNAVQLRGKYLVSASGDGIARLWDIDRMKLIQEFSAKERGLAAVEFSEDMKYVLAGGNDHITYKFEVETGKEVKQFTGHNQLVRSLWLDSANNRVVSGSYDLDLRVYDFVTGEEIWRAKEWTTSWMLAAKSDYRRIVATSQDGRILIVDFGLQKGGCMDGQPIENVDLLRGVENTNAIIFRNPWVSSPSNPELRSGISWAPNHG